MTTRPTGCSPSPNVHRGAFSAGFHFQSLASSNPKQDFKMKIWLSFLGAVMALTPFVQTAVNAQTANEEQRLIAVLQSGASLAEKDAACARLKLIGTAHCVPELSALLSDEQLSHSARYALEPMQAPEAGQALLDALPKTKGLIKVGLINSLG